MKGPKGLEVALESLQKLPGIGVKTAERLAFYLLSRPVDEVLELSEALKNLTVKVRLCKICFALSEHEFCEICQDSSRDSETILVVEDPMDLFAFERINEYRGKYHVLMGTIRPLDGIGPNDLHISSLIKRVKQDSVTEVILATNPNTEGEATAMYLSKLLNDENVTVSRIASGIPVGGDIEYVDEVTLYKSLKGRLKI
ncbi:MAG: recombination mediator RecR [Nitrospinota bacterium]